MVSKHRFYHLRLATQILTLSGAWLLSFVALAQQGTNELVAEQQLNRGLSWWLTGNYAPGKDAFTNYETGAADGLRKSVAGYYKAYSGLKLFHPDAEQQLVLFADQYPHLPQGTLARFDLGNFYYQQKDYSRVIKYLKPIKTNDLDPELKPASDFRLAYAYLTQKQFKPADSLFNIVKNTENAYTTPAHYYAAYLAVKTGKFETALKSLDKVEKDPTYKAMAPQLRCIILYRRKEYDKVIEVGEKTLNDTAKSQALEEIALLVAESYYVKQSFEPALKYYDKFIPNNKAAITPQLRYRMAYTMLKAGQHARAADNFKLLAYAKADTALANAKDSLAQYSAYYLGNAYLAAANKTSAAASFKHAMQLPQSKYIQDIALFTYAKIRFDEQDYDEAIEQLSNYEERFPKGVNRIEASELLAEAYLNTTDYDEALKYIESVQKRTKRIDEAYQRVTYHKGVQLFNEGKYNEAALQFEESLNFPLVTEVANSASYWGAEALANGKKYAEAIPRYQYVLRVGSKDNNPEYIKAVYGLGYAFFNKRTFNTANNQFEVDYAKAAQQFKDFIAQTEGKAAWTRWHADAILRYADCLFTSKDFKGAIAQYEKAAKAGVPEGDYVLFQQGMAATYNNKPAESAQYLQTLLSKFQDSRLRDKAQFQLAQISFNGADYSKAVELFSVLINTSLDPTVLPWCYLKRALAFNNLQQSEKAIADFIVILDRYTQHETASDALNGLQTAFERSNQEDQLAQYVDKFKLANPEVKSVASIEFESAKNLYFAQKYDKAQVAMQRYLASDSTSAGAQELQFLLAETLYRLDQKPAAALRYEKVIANAQNPNYNKALARVADIQAQQGNWSLAKESYQKLLKLARNSKETSNATVGLMEAYFNLNNLDSAGYFAQDITLRANSTADAQVKAHLYQGKRLLAIGKTKEGCDELLNVVNEVNDSHAAEAAYLLAENQFKQGQFNQSLQASFENNKKYSEYSKWYDRNFLLIADNYVALKKMTEATYALEKLVEKSPNKDMVELAKQKLSQIQTPPAQP